ncbi:Ig-like and fibronectin type-III domain-containing protein 2 isoform X1 [Drosophila albomicans]|uniref:Ig-like and fibronectin type-III domain-containing protein 2 isoform X1 n=1 Tax=Drosophila albomicans TaxID=7291 RepID=A0A6P8Z359_DROAB|nr:Ig-like and fibronectin type-III domain-containing protein 2 isoform X1 [Drosophila albomicans]XP_034111307.1 Ig-like and fibronectin type-III domain-containing protein 2 isoform X1 [Drosophila albomicans]
MLKPFGLKIITICLLFTNVNSGVPIGTGGPSQIFENKDGLLTCVVSENVANNTVIWKKGDEILTAGSVRVTNDNRVRVLHDGSPKGRNLETGGEVWVLLIKDLKTSDSGAYICELNSDPVLRSIHILTVKEVSQGNSTDTATAESSDVFLLPPPLNAQDNRSFWRPSQSPPVFTHDFTECCERANVSTQCMGFCNVHNILDGTTDVDPEACEKDFPSIVKCMADGRNHVPCCVEKQIPDLCQDMCRGEYTPFTDRLKTRVSCVHHTLSGLQCILKGVQQIPSMPVQLSVDQVREKSVNISWSPPQKLADQVSHYSVNLTTLHSFDEDELSGEVRRKSLKSTEQQEMELTKLYNVPANQTYLYLDSLSPLTMYAVILTAVNEYGSSLPNERLRFFTHTSASVAETQAGNTDKQVMPTLPDIRGCCESSGMTHRLCMDKMCDPEKADQATLPDLMVCAPWSNITFTCLANNIDHTPCCRARGIPSACFPLCAGKLTSLDFSLFKCLRFMSEYSSCLFQGYGVLADPPSKLRTVAKTDSFVILDWNKPKRLADTVTTFHVKFRRLGVGDDYLTVEKRQPPLILEGLEADIYYEFYVVSINAYGKSEPSPRLITRTLAAELDPTPVAKYNMSTCCQASGLLPQCAPLCSYNIRLSDIENLGPTCRAQMPILARCAAGGRDHSPCCSRRGVINACMPLCRGVMPLALSTKSTAATAASTAAGIGTLTSTGSSTLASNVPDCLSYAGNILQCFEEGTNNIPGPPEDVHATSVTSRSISLAWTPPTVETASISSSATAATPVDMITGDELAAAAGIVAGDVATAAETSTTTTSKSADSASATNADDIDFVVQYGRVNNMTMYETIAKLENELTTNETSIDLTNLDENTLYRITVVARGKFGTSLPASMLLLNTSSVASENVQHSNDTWGAPSPPHSLTVLTHSATWMQLTWQPPEYSHPHERITYRVYHKMMKTDGFTKIETKLAWLRLTNLKPSSQHVLYVEAVGERASSLPSETLVAWTDPALPAFVDPPTVHPADNIPEGGSMTILCLALGNPAPTISLYVGGHLVRQDTSRHMVTVIHNVSADMEHVSCYADNGYGVPMQATRRVNICYPPKIQAAGITVASVGDEVELRCTVDSKPAPKTIFWRDHDGRVPVPQGGNYYVSVANVSTIYTMSLRISKLQANDVGDYFCHAENPFGSSTTPVSVRIRNTPSLNRNVSQCCAEQNVSMACRDACTYYVDFDAIANRPECIVDFDKLMKCAADGSDHRSCCAEEHVPRKCLNWCRGETVRAKEICSLQYSRTIIGCFEKNRDRLPGPPENIVVSVMSDNEVNIKWDAPTKNPNAVDGYRIYYHEAAVVPPTSSSPSESSMEPASTSDTMNNATSMGNGNSNNNQIMLAGVLEIKRIDVKDTTISINGLKKDVLYELVVKAGNSYGASVLTDPIRFTLGEQHVTSATSSYSSAVGTISGIVASILAILLAAAAIVFYRRHRSHHGKAGNGNVAFENPTYTRGLEQVQLPTVTSAITTQQHQQQPHNNGSNHTQGSNSNSQSHSHSHSSHSHNGNGHGVAATMTTSTSTATATPDTGTTANGSRHHQSNGHRNGLSDAAHHFHNPLSNTQCNEVNPSIYEELKLGQEGAGFKKLVP